MSATVGAQKSGVELFLLDPSSRVNVTFRSDENFKERSAKMFGSIRDDLFMVRLRQIAWENFRDKKSIQLVEKGGDMRTQIMSMLEETGLREVIANTAIRLYERNAMLHLQRSLLDTSLCVSRKASNETIECIREARLAWEQGINEELMAIASEMKRPFAMLRPPGALHPLLEANALQSADSDSVRFLFDSEDLLETGVAIRSPNMKQAHCDRSIGMIKVYLSTPRLVDLAKRFSDLSPSLTQIGLDENHATLGSKFCAFRHEEGDAIGTFGNALDARKYLRRGCPTSLRSRVWRVALALPEELSAAEEKNFVRLRVSCDRLDLLTDELFLHDVQNVIDDPRFFVFEEELKEAVLCFARDDWVRHNAVYEVHRPLHGLVTAEQGPGVTAPPSAVQPFLGLAIYFAPLCYVFRDRAALYSASRILWCRLWCRLNVLSGDAGTLLHVCATFESLLMSAHPRLFIHLVNIGVQPLQVALPWMQLGFVGLLEMDQILFLWDRLVGYQDPLLLAVLAVAVFIVRAEALLTCGTSADALMMLMEGSRLRVVPLLQMIIFTDNN